jgi:anaerobic ribonucleoside-triphosphate reductase activating protein
LNIGGIIHESLNDGIGIRTVLFISGCKHNCFNCHNQRLSNFNYGKPFNKEMQDYIINYINTDSLIDGITLSGGDPLYSEDELIEFLKQIKSKSPTKTIWAYTGFKFEDIKNHEMLKYIDVLVDGEFIEKLKDTSLKFKGSSNQRIINVNESLKQSEVILWNN